MELCIHILIVTYTNNSLTIKKYMHVTPKGWKMWFCLKYDQKWQKWPKLCCVLLYLRYVSDLESLKPFWERQGFSQWFGMESPNNNRTKTILKDSNAICAMIDSLCNTWCGGPNGGTASTWIEHLLYCRNPNSLNFIHGTILFK